MTEFALVVPVLMVLIMGVLDGALLMFSVGTARYSSAEGSRVAATLGNVANTDSQVVATVRNIVSGTQLFTVNYTYTWKAGFFAPLGPLRTTAISYVRIEPQSY